MNRPRSRKNRRQQQPNPPKTVSTTLDWKVQYLPPGEMGNVENPPISESGSEYVFIIPDKKVDDYSTITNESQFSLASLNRYETERIEEVEKMYRFVDKANVVEYLKTWPLIIDTLKGARAVITRIFPNSDVRLEVFRNPESADDITLLAKIGIKIEPLKANELLNKFDDEFWLDVPFKIRRKVCVMLEFL